MPPISVENAPAASHIPRRVDPTSRIVGESGNVPSEISSFIEREGELARVSRLLDQTRLVTLVGPSGVGKTRLALRLAAALEGSFTDGAWLVELSPISDASLVPQALADVLGVRQQPGKSWLEALTRALRPRTLLVVLDNCEHLAGACADLVTGLLRACPNLRVLATSLQPLGLSAETTWRVPPLSLPPPSLPPLSLRSAAASESQELQRSEAVRLFVARVCSHLPDFELNEQNAQIVAEICRRLDGLPLALELVAARVESLGLVQVAGRLDDRFRLAVGGSHAAPTRQRTLQAALEWTCSLLDADERVLLRRLGVFRGGWTLAAAEAVCAGGALTKATVVDVLERLVIRSLVIADHRDLQVHYRLLETVRAYAVGQLAVAGEIEMLRYRHAACLMQLAEQTEPLSIAGHDAARLQLEQDNVRTALEWALERDEVEIGLRLASAVHPLWVYSGHYAEGRTWLERLLALPAAQTPSLARAKALTSHGQLLLLGSDFAGAEASARAALAQYTARGDARGSGLAFQVLGNTALQRGDLADADALHTRAVEQLREAGSPGVVLSLVQQTLIACELGDTQRARTCIVEFEGVDNGASDPYVLATAVYERGLVAAVEGDAPLAATLFEDSLARSRVMGYQQGNVVILTSLGHTRLDLGQTDAGLAAFGEALKLARVSGERHRVIRALEGVARWLASSDADVAVRLAAATDGQRRTIGAAAFPSERRYLDRWLANARRTLGAHTYEQAWHDGHASTLDQAVSLTEALIQARVAQTIGSLLSPRETEVAALLGRGLTNKQIAAELVVSPATVRSHVEHILAKLDLTSRAQIAVWASQQGLLRKSTQP